MYFKNISLAELEVRASLKMLVLLAVIIAIAAPASSWSHNCTPVCTCAKDVKDRIHARCVVQRLPSEDVRKLPENVYSLSIENSTITRIPLSSFRGLESLRVLKLRNNSIQSIDRGALKTLDKLIELDLRYNDIKTWRIFSANVLPSLKILRMSGNKRWLPDLDILQLQGLTEIRDITLSSYCGECTLIKNNMNNITTNNVTMDICHVTLSEFFPHHKEVTYRRSYDFVKHGYSPQCLCISPRCQMHEIDIPYFKQLYSIPKKLFYLQYALGAAVLCLNLVIIFVVISSQSLRCNASFVLICSMSLSDLFVGMYTIGIAVSNPFKASNVTPTELMSNDNEACPYLGFVFTTGQTTAVFTSLFLTVERYLAIIRCIRPRQKLDLRYSLLISLVIWLVGILYALLPVFGVQYLQYHKWFQCTMPFHKSSVIDDTSLVTLVIVSGFVVIYVASVALYIYMYFVFCKSTAHLAIRREARLAKRLSLVVGTNFLFFVVPTVLFLVYVYRFKDVLFDVASTFANLQGFIIMGSWVPVTLLGIGSLINPFVYAFRHQKFRREIGRVFRRLDKYFGEVTQEEINSPHHYPHHHHQVVTAKMKHKELEQYEQTPYLMRRHADVEL